MRICPKLPPRELAPFDCGRRPSMASRGFRSQWAHTAAAVGPHTCRAHRNSSIRTGHRTRRRSATTCTVHRSSCTPTAAGVRIAGRCDRSSSGIRQGAHRSYPRAHTLLRNLALLASALVSLDDQRLSQATDLCEVAKACLLLLQTAHSHTVAAVALHLVAHALRRSAPPP